METYQALRILEQDGRFIRRIETLPLPELKAGEIQIQVAWSSVNYKDALSSTGNRGVTRQYPHTPGIDAAGTVTVSMDDRFPVGTPVLVTGYDLGMNTDGGFGEVITVPADWAVRLPQGLTAQDVMAIGTAGFTAAMAIAALSDFVKPGDGPVLVTGATGGVGSMTIKLLSKIGYEAAAVTGKADQAAYLTRIGAAQVIDRTAFLKDAHKVLLKETYAGGVDTLGGEPLAQMLKQLRQGGAAAACGNAASGDLALTVYPFILRGVRLLGIDSQKHPMPLRQAIWDRLSAEWKLPEEQLYEGVQILTLDELPDYLDAMLAGRICGRALLRHAL